MTEKKSIKEHLNDCLFPKKEMILNEVNGTEESTGPAPVNDPDPDAENPDPEDLFTRHNSILFLTASNKEGIIKRGEGMGFMELNEKAIEKGMEIDLEDFQWWCLASDFEKYLSKTGRKYSSSSGEWTSEGKESGMEEHLDEDKERKISSYSDFLKENIKINESNGIIDFLGGERVTSKGMSYTGGSPDFQRGKMTDTQRKFIKFLFTRNSLRNSKQIEEKLDLKSLEVNKAYEFFVSAFDPTTGKSDETAMIGLTVRILANIPAQGGIETPIIVCQIEKIAPNTGNEKSSSQFEDVLEKVVDNLYKYYDSFMNALDTTTGKIFAAIASISALSNWGVFGSIAGAFAVMRITSSFRSLQRSVSGVSVKPGLISRAFSRVGKGGLNFLKGAPRVPGQVFRGSLKLLKFPLTAVKQLRINVVKYNKIKRTGSLKGWKAARYILFGNKARRAGLVAKGVRALSGAGKWTNPIGWVLLATDVIGSTLNYTSDNQAPSWDPIIGDKTDAMKNYSGENGLCPSAKNKFTPSDIKIGENITLCWTQNPESGFGLALSFVVSNSTRTTMNLTKVHDFKAPNESVPGMSLFLVNSVNYKSLWDKIKGFDLRFLFIKNNTYEEGYSDDNIGAYFLPASAKPDPENILPISYYGHCDYEVFHSTYTKAPDQLVIVDKKAPDEYKFYFYDSESNPINVIGKKVTDKDIENASEEEINSFFDVEPVSSYIGNPESETEEEKSQREEAENAYKSSMSSEEEESEDLAKNENEKWYSSIESSKPITSFSDFKMVKESLLLEENPPGITKGEAQELPSGQTEGGGEEVKGEGSGKDDPSKVSIFDRVTTIKQYHENFQKILDVVEAPFEYAIYFVQLREYADPDLRDIYKPGSFTNFYITQDAISASNGSSVDGEVQVNNLDFLIDPRKGEYTLSAGERKDKEEEKKKDKKGLYSDVEASDTILTPYKDSEDEPSVTRTRIDKEEDKKRGIMQRVDPDILSSLDIQDWDDVTSVKIIKDREGNPKTIKINNKKARIGDKLRRFEKGDSNFEDALKLADAYEEKKRDEEELSKK